MIEVYPFAQVGTYFREILQTDTHLADLSRDR
jgi:hypothetical protein